MSVTAVVGACWGDEGKGKIVDWLAEEADYVVRFQGGRNAGHTIVNAWGRNSLHLLPSGVFRQNVVNVIGPGVAVDIAALLEELEQLRAVGVPAPTLWVSDRAQVVLPFHTLFDALEEERLGAASFGSTRVGILTQVALVPTWFLAVYVMVGLVVPLTLAAWERFGFGSFAALVVYPVNRSRTVE